MAALRAIKKACAKNQDQILDSKVMLTNFPPGARVVTAPPGAAGPGAGPEEIRIVRIVRMVRMVRRKCPG